jgi:hypothetical protein
MLRGRIRRQRCKATTGGPSLTWKRSRRVSRSSARISNDRPRGAGWQITSSGVHQQDRRHECEERQQRAKALCPYLRTSCQRAARPERRLISDMAVSQIRLGRYRWILLDPMAYRMHCITRSFDCKHRSRPAVVVVASVPEPGMLWNKAAPPSAKLLGGARPASRGGAAEARARARRRKSAAAKEQAGGERRIRTSYSKAEAQEHSRAPDHNSYYVVIWL